MRPASVRIFRWWDTVGCERPSGSTSSHTHASPAGADATRLSSRSRTGSARTANAPASSAALSSVSGVDRTAGQQLSDDPLTTIDASVRLIDLPQYIKETPHVPSTAGSER